MARFDAFIGPSYTSQSPIADNEICVNWFVEPVEVPGGSSLFVLYDSPGTQAFCELNGMAAVRTFLEFGGRVFSVAENLAQQFLWEISQDGTSDLRGSLGTAGTMPYLAVNNANQLMIASGGQLFLFKLDTNKLSEIDTTTGNALQGRVSSIWFDDAYFIAILKNSPKFQISNLADGSTWDPTRIGEPSEHPDNILAAAVDHRELWLFGPKQSIAYYDSGNPDFPFDPVPAGFIEYGIAAPDSVCKADHTMFWVGADKNGQGVGVRAEGYKPVRITNHAVEFAWQGYIRDSGTISDAKSYAYQENGHTFWHVYFPTANKSWRYDIATGLWHEVADTQDGKSTAHRSQCHVSAFGKHLVGDWKSGIVYEQSSAMFSYDGRPLSRVRRCPQLNKTTARMFISRMQLFAETGFGPVVNLTDGQGNPRGPMMNLRVSPDGGRTWGDEMPREFVQSGKGRQRIYWNRLGSAYSPVLEVKYSDPTPCRIVGADLE